jgi:hypothetical protein
VQRPVPSTPDSDVELRFDVTDTDAKYSADSSIVYTAAGEKLAKYRYASWIVTEFQWANNAWVETGSYGYMRYDFTPVYFGPNEAGWWEFQYPVGRINGIISYWGKPEEWNNRVETVYDSGGNLTHIYQISETVRYIYEITYNTYGFGDYRVDRPVHIKNYAILYYDNNRIQNFGEKRYEYNTRGDLTLFENYSWDSDRNTWVVGNEHITGKEVNTYDADGRLLSTEEYTADEVRNRWIPSTRTVRKRDERGRETREDEYVWFENSWALVRYTIHYYPDNVSNETVAGAAIWSYGSNLYVRTPQPTALYIYTIAGSLYRQQTLPAGETTIPLPQGMYLVQTGKTVKKILIR